MKERHPNYRHGEGATRLYFCWQTMRSRCSNPNGKWFHRYGGRGIQICEDWGKWENFRDWAIRNGYKEGLTLERVNNDGNYEPSNCKWISRGEQSKNRKTNVYLELDGKRQILSDWAKEVGIKPHTLRARVRDYGWNVRDAITKPITK